MKKYVSRATKWVGIIALLCCAALFVGIILSLAKISMASVAMMALGSVLGILFLSCFLAEKSRELRIDAEKVIFPRGADKNGKMILQKTTVKFCDIDSVDTNLCKGDGIISGDTFFHIFTLKDGTKITVTLYAYGKEAEEEIIDTVKRGIK